MPPDIAELTRGFRDARPDPLQVVEGMLARIESDDARIRAFIEVLPERARAQASASRERWLAGRPLGPLDGVPYALKDNIGIAGLACSAGTDALAQRRVPADAPVQARLASTGAVLLGRLNMHEGALGATTDNPVWGRCENPLAPGHTPGGSSGGSAAAVAAGFCTFALGTDTMGSVRVPASYCGLYGFKPSHDAISIEGIIPLEPTLDAVGPIAASAADAVSVARALLPERPDNGLATWRGLRIGLPRQLEQVPLETEVEAAHRRFVSTIEALGAQTMIVDLPDWTPGAARRAGLLLAEASAHDWWTATLGDALAGLSSEFIGMLRYPLRAGQERVAAARALIERLRATTLPLYQQIDLLLLPTTPHRSFAHGAPVPVDQADLTALANFLGAPAIAIPVPCAEGLPASVQLIAAPGDDHRLLDWVDALPRPTQSASR